MSAAPTSLVTIEPRASWAIQHADTRITIGREWLAVDLERDDDTLALVLGDERETITCTIHLEPIEALALCAGLQRATPGDIDA